METCEVLHHFGLQRLPTGSAEQDRCLPGFDQLHVLRQYPGRSRVIELALKSLRIKPDFAIGQQYRQHIFQASADSQCL
ncbi:hypothetical protein D3C75_1338320 [compost metagenome]